MAGSEYILNIGSKKYSSWSLRVWLLMRMKDIDFEERKIPFINVEGRREFNAETKRRIAAVSLTGRLPSLCSGNIRISESLPILEYLNEMHPERQLWPVDPDTRAHARMLAGAIHSGFQATRTILPFVGDGRRKEVSCAPDGRLRDELSVLLDILPAAISTKSNSGFLYGDFCIADAMLVPFVMRYHNYNVDVPEHIGNYTRLALSTPALRNWIAEADGEPETISEIEAIHSMFPEEAPVEYKL